jgi:hypothetical protein
MNLPPAITLSPLDAVTGDEALYPQFYRAFVQRKRQELIAPVFIGIGEIILPRASLVHFFPNNPQEIGPSISEAFISNYPDEVFVEFPAKYTPVIGSGRAVAINARQVIQGYRGSHYKYNWTKDIGTVYNKEKVLVVKSYGLADMLWHPRASLFINFERYYNHFNLLMEGANEEAVKGRRKQFFRIDLPLHLPSFSDLMIDYDHYVESFRDGLPLPSNKTVRTTKQESSYWLMDWMAFLFGDYQYSLLNKLSDKAIEDFHLIFVFNSRALVIHLGTLKGWLDAELDKNVAIKEEKLPKSDREKHGKRLNASKRVYLALLNLTRGGVTEEEVVKEEESNEREGEKAEKAERLAAEEKGASKGQGKASGGSGEGTLPRKNDGGRTASHPDPLRDAFGGSQEADDGVPEGTRQEGDGTDLASTEEWTSHVDDRLLEQEKVVAETSVKKDPFPKFESGIAAALEERAREGSLTVAEQQFFMRKGTQVYHIEMENGQSLAEYMEIKPESLKELTSDAKIEGNFPTILDQSMLQSRAKVLKQGYVDKFLLKDMAQMAVAIQNAGFALNDYKHEVVEGVEGAYDVITIQVHPVDGEQSTHPIRFPRVSNDDASFTVDGVKSHLQLQRMELPIRKIDSGTVLLTSHYDRQLMVTRSKKVVDDLGVWLKKQILLRAMANKDITLSRGNGRNRDYTGPRIYTILASRFQWINVGGYMLDFRIEKLLEDHPEFKKFTKPDMFLVGVKDKKPITIDSYGNLYLDGVEFNTFEGLMGINFSKAPNEHAVVNISGFLFPLGVVLCYYFGIDELLKVIKATTRTVPMGTRPKLAEDEYAIQFNDEYLIFNRREKLTTLIFGGMPKLNNISNFSRSDLNNKGIWGPLMGDPKVRPTQFLEMNLLYKMFVDPITKKELHRMGYSESFHHLLIDAAKLLETDYTPHEVELEEQRIVGYERFAGHFYKVMVGAQRQYFNKGKGRKQKLEINPEAAIMSILKDTSVNRVEEVNPIHQLKDQEELTFGGTGGRSEITVVKRARVQLKSYKGKVSEANKDSGKVGFVTYTTSDPLVLDYRGNIDTKSKPSPTSLYSVTGNLAFGMNKDDTKRGMFTSTQASQAVSAQNYTMPITRTGYDNIIAQRTSELYSKVAKDAGKVTAVVEDHLEITYNDGTVEKYPLGLVIGEASGEYHRHTRVTDLKVGDKFTKGEVLGWDQQWFARDPFCPGQVVWKSGRQVRIALVEDQDTYEDSIAVSKEIMAESITPFLTKNSFAVDVDKVVTFKVKQGDQIDYDAILCEIEESHLAGAGEETTQVDEINRLGIKQIRSKYHGEVVKIEVTYNSPVEKMSDSVRKLIATSDKERKRMSSIDGSFPTGSVGNNLNVAKPVLSPGKVLFTVYVESMDGSTTSDKYVIGNQMKGTVNGVMKKPLMTQDGRVVDVKCSFKGGFNRMVLSLRDRLGTSELAVGVTKQAIAIYRGK